MKILLISGVLPYPPIVGFSLRVYNLLRRLSRRHEIWLLSLVTDLSDEREAIAHLKQYCREVRTIPKPMSGALAQPKELVRYLVAGMPPDLRLYQSEAMIKSITELTSQVDFDVVQIEDTHLALYLEALPQNYKATKVLTLHDIAFSKYRRIHQIEKKPARKLRSWLHSQMLQRWEPRYLANFDLCIAMSDVDRAILLEKNPHLRVEVIPNGIDTELYQLLPYEEAQHDLIFVGDMDYLPNVDAMIYFTKEILPLIRKEIKDIQMWIVGLNPRPAVRTLAGNGVHVTGRVDDVRQYYQRSNICVIPLRAGGGTRLKILESMALGRPVVSTSIGCEGIHAIDGEHILIADSPSEFAEKTICLLTKTDLRQHIIRQARQFVVEHYDWERIATRYMDLLDASRKE